MDDAPMEFGSKEAGKKGGKARAAKLSKEKLSEIARIGAESRWQKAGHQPVPVATHGSPDRPLRIGDFEIPCYVLGDGRRVLHQRGMVRALGMARGSSGGTGGDRLAKFTAGDRLKPYVSSDLISVTANPVRFRTPGGQDAYGYEATVLADICEAVLKARRDGVLQKQQAHIAEQCEILVRGFARVGIIALVDEATGFQDDRDRFALAKILERFIAKEIQKYLPTFPMDFYEELFRLWDIPYERGKPIIKRPSFIAGLTNNFIYSRLAPGVLAEMRRLNPVTENGRRARKHFQHLTRDLGHPKLKEHLAAVVALMRAAPDKATFLAMINRALPKYQEAPLFEQPVEAQKLLPDS